MHRRVRRPRKEEQTDGESDGAHHRGTESRFGLHLFPRRLGRGTQTHVTFIVDACERRSETDANRDGDEGEPREAFVPAARVLEDDGDGGEEHVEGPVDDGHVERGQQDDRFEEEEDPGAREGDLEFLREGLGWGADVVGGDVGVSGHFGEGGCARAQDDGAVCFGGDERGGYPDDAGEDGD